MLVPTVVVVWLGVAACATKSKSQETRHLSLLTTSLAEPSLTLVEVNIDKDHVPHGTIISDGKHAELDFGPYPPRCNGENVKERDLRACQSWLYEIADLNSHGHGNFVCGAKPKGKVNLCHRGSCKVTIRAHETDDKASISCDAVAETLGFIWNKCGTRGGEWFGNAATVVKCETNEKPIGSAQGNSDRLVIHVNNDWA